MNAVIRITDYGARPDSGEDAVPAMQRAIEMASQIRGPVVLECLQGCYDFYPDHAARIPYHISNTASEAENPDVTKIISVLFKGINNLTLEGNESLFIFHGKQTMFVMDDCENIEICHLHTDFAHPTVVEMTVEASESDYLDISVHSDFHYEIEAGKLSWIGDGWRFRGGFMQECDPDKNTTWRIDNLLEQAIKVEEIGPLRLRLHYDFIPSKLKGRILQVRDGVRDQIGVFMLKSRNIKWSQVGLHCMHGLGMVGQYSENLVFDRMNLAPRPETGRTVTAFADFIHLSGCRGKIEITNSCFMGGHDDAVNIHGTHLGIMDIPAPKQLLLRFMHEQSYGFEAFFPGDEIELVRTGTLLAYASNAVKSAAFIDPRHILLTLEQPVSNEIRIGDVVENVTWTPEVEISHNHFAGIPTRGILVTTRRKVLIENNRFERMAMSAVLVADDAESWYESGRVEDIAIRGNWFIECGSGEHPVIYIAPENTSISAGHPVHHNIRIENNSFQTTSALVLHAKSTRQLCFKHNEILIVKNQKGLRTIEDWIHLSACSVVTNYGNRLEKRE